MQHDINTRLTKIFGYLFVSEWKRWVVVYISYPFSQIQAEFKDWAIAILNKIESSLLYFSYDMSDY